MSEGPIYDSAVRPPRALEELLDAYRYRHLIAEFVRRDIVTRYKRSTLGVLWTMLNPLGTMLIMMVVFYQLFHITTPKYPIFVLSGLISWGFFSQVTSAAPQTLLWSGPLVHRVYIPRTLFAFTSVGAGLVNLMLSFVPLAVIMAILRVPPTPALLSLPLAVLLLTLFSLGLGLLLSTWTVYFPDVIDIYAIFLTAWMYVSAIFYPYEIIPIEYRWWFFNLNPMYHLILLFRDPLYYGNWPSLAHVGAATVVAVSMLLIGWFAFARKADELAYRL
ncbi:MAG: ABC transporter permease [Coriobacteriia bacterium]|nr:ABC transporter permease [Coriobacteriia bacterium]